MGFDLSRADSPKARSFSTIVCFNELSQLKKTRFFGGGVTDPRICLTLPEFFPFARLTRYEIPVDSRITKWLKKLPFPVPLSANLLIDTEYYEFVEAGIQALCAACDLFPCVLDAAIFASFDKEEWTKEISVW